MFVIKRLDYTKSYVVFIEKARRMQALVWTGGTDILLCLVSVRSELTQVVSITLTHKLSASCKPAYI